MLRQRTFSALRDGAGPALALYGIYVAIRAHDAGIQ